MREREAVSSGPWPWRSGRSVDDRAGVDVVGGALGGGARERHGKRIGVVGHRVAGNGLRHGEAAQDFDGCRVARVRAVTGVVGEQVDGSILVVVEGCLVLSNARKSVVIEHDFDRHFGWGCPRACRVGPQARRHLDLEAHVRVAWLSTTSERGRRRGGPRAVVRAAIGRENVAEVSGQRAGRKTVVDQRELVEDGVASRVDAIPGQDWIARSVDDVFFDVDLAYAVAAVAAAVGSNGSDLAPCRCVGGVDSKDAAVVVAEQVQKASRIEPRGAEAAVGERSGHSGRRDGAGVWVDHIERAVDDLVDEPVLWVVREVSKVDRRRTDVGSCAGERVNRPEVPTISVKPTSAVSGSNGVDDVAAIAEHRASELVGVVWVGGLNRSLEDDAARGVIGTDGPLPPNIANAVDPVSSGVIGGRVRNPAAGLNRVDREVPRYGWVGDDQLELPAAHEHRCAVAGPLGVGLRFGFVR